MSTSGAEDDAHREEARPPWGANLEAGGGSKRSSSTLFCGAETRSSGALATRLDPMLLCERKVAGLVSLNLEFTSRFGRGAARATAGDAAR